MLQALLLFSAVVIAEAGAWDPAPFNAIPTHASNPFFTPEEPTTLVLGIIGGGIVVAYGAAQMLSRPKRKITKTARPEAKGKRAA
jgi:hypothetical protein